MPLGDSITKGLTGSDPPGGYRDSLYYNLTISGIVCDFVGTQILGEGFDADHEGHGGKTAQWMADTVAYFYSSQDPDIILLHIGTNDISSQREITDIIDDIASILDQGRAHNPLLKMMVAGLIPRTDGYDDETTALNVAIQGLVAQKEWQGYDITYVDHNTAFKSIPGWDYELMYDTRHPKNRGYDVMARVWLDSLGLVPPLDTIPPSPVSDMSIVAAGPATATLAWTAPGDDSTVGYASIYDIRYSTSPITEESFALASEAHSEPRPLAQGTDQEFIVSGLSPGHTYYFALKSLDEAQNVSALSNIPMTVTIDDSTVFVDDFNREELGPKWVHSDSVVIEGDEMSGGYDGGTGLWNVRAVYSYARNPSWAMFRFGQNNSETENGSVGLMMQRTSLNLNQARSYLIRYFNYAYHLYIMNNTSEPVPLGDSVSEPNPPQPGDLLAVEFTRVGNGNYFDVYLNDVYRGTLADASGIIDTAGTRYAGIAFKNEVVTKIAEIDDFTVGGAMGNQAPSPFALITPVDRDTLDGSSIIFAWHKAVDPDPSSVVMYEFQFSLDSLFTSAMIVSDLAETLFVMETDTLDDVTYFWQVIAYDEYDDRTPSDGIFSFFFHSGSGIDRDTPESPGIPKVASLSQNYPNPFNPTTMVAYDVPGASARSGGGDGVRVLLQIFDIRGHHVRTLVERNHAPGTYRVVWDGRDGGGNSLPSGPYIYMIRIGDVTLSRKMMLLR